MSRDDPRHNPKERKLEIQEFIVNNVNTADLIALLQNNPALAAQFTEMLNAQNEAGIKCLADPLAKSVLETVIEHGEMSTSEIQEVLRSDDISDSAISSSRAKLADAGLLHEARKEGKTPYYAASRDQFNTLLDHITPSAWRSQDVNDDFDY